MVRISLNDDLVPAGDRVFRGHWCLQSDSTNVLSGSLTISERATPVLEVYGTLMPADVEYEQGFMSAIWGETLDGEKITLLNASRRSQVGTPFHGAIENVSKIRHETWEGAEVAVGAHLPDGRNTAVSSMQFRSHLLRAWAEPLLPRITTREETRDTSTFGGTLQIPKPLIAYLPAGQLVLSWDRGGSTKGASMDFFVQPTVEVRLTNSMSMDETWPLLVVPLLQMFTLFVGSGDWLHVLRFTPAVEVEETAATSHDAQGFPLWAGRFELVSGSWMAESRDSKAPWKHSHLWKAIEVAPKFSEAVPKWFALQARLSGPFADYFAVHMWPKQTIEEAFQRVTRALEATHEVLYPKPRIPKAEFRALRESMRESIRDSPHVELLMSRLTHADAPSLKDRLTDLFGKTTPRFKQWAPGGVAAFIQAVVRTRNNMTHGGAEGPLVGAALYEAQTILDMLMRATLLRELGLAPEEIQDKLVRTDDARWIAPAE